MTRTRDFGIVLSAIFAVFVAIAFVSILDLAVKAEQGVEKKALSYAATLYRQLSGSKSNTPDFDVSARLQNDDIPLPRKWNNGVMGIHERGLAVASRNFPLFAIKVRSQSSHENDTKVEYHLGVIRGCLYSADILFKEWLLNEKALMARNASPEVFEVTRTRTLASLNPIIRQTNVETHAIVDLLKNLSPTDPKQKQEKQAPAGSGTYT